MYTIFNGIKISLLFLLLLGTLIPQSALALHYPFIKDSGIYFVRLEDSLVKIDRKAGISVIKNGRELFNEYPAFFENPRTQEGRKLEVKFIKGKEEKIYESTDVLVFSESDVDLIYTVKNGGVEKTLLLKPGADLNRIIFVVKGAEIEPDGKGGLLIKKGKEVFKISKPIAYQYEGKNKVFVDIHYKVYKGGYGFYIESYDESKTLIIDPVLNYVTDGGSQVDVAYAIAESGTSVYVAGYTISNDFSLLSGGYGGGKDIFIIKYSKNLNSIEYAIYYGGSGDEEVFDIKVDNSGSIYLVGYSNSQEICGSVSSDQILILKFNASLSLLGKNCIGNSKNSRAYKLILDASHLYLTGFTEDTLQGFPGFKGVRDAIVIKVDKGNLSNIYKITYLGGSNVDEGIDLAHDSTYIYVLGTTLSNNIDGINVNSFQSSINGNKDAFISKIKKADLSVEISTYLGGSGEDTAVSVRYVNQWNDIALLLNTLSADLPVVGGAGQKGMQDIYIARLSNDLSQIKRSSYLGGENVDRARDMEIDTSLNVYITGTTYSPDLPSTQGSVQENIKGGGDAFIIKLHSDFSSAISTYLGGTDDDISHDINLDGDNIYSAGFTKSTDFLKAPNEVSTQKGNDMFVVLITNSLKKASTGGALPGGGGGGGGGTAYAPIKETESGKGCSVFPGVYILILLTLLTFKKILQYKN